MILSLHELELAARVSDRILCVDGAFVEQVGTPEEIFRPGHLSKLFQITQGSFEEESQEMELAAVKGTPEVFVIAGNGSGRNTFRRLQREGIPLCGRTALGKRPGLSGGKGTFLSAFLRTGL